MLQLFSPRCPIEICSRQDFDSAIEAAVNRSQTKSLDTITVIVGSSDGKLCTMYTYFLTYLRITYVRGEFSLNKLRNQPDIFHNGYLNTTKFFFFFCFGPTSGLVRLSVETHRHNRTPLNEWSARRRGRYLPNTQQTQETKSMPSAGFESAMPVIKRLHTYVLYLRPPRSGLKSLGVIKTSLTSP